MHNKIWIALTNLHCCINKEHLWDSNFLLFSYNHWECMFVDSLTECVGPSNLEFIGHLSFKFRCPIKISDQIRLRSHYFSWDTKKTLLDVRPTSHTRLRARNHYISSTLCNKTIILYWKFSLAWTTQPRDGIKIPYSHARALYIPPHHARLS